ncbi:MAG: MFS transporter [Hyphomicrobiales bacterium]
MSRFPGLSRIIETLRSANYGSYVAGNGVSLVGTWMQRMAVGWLAWDMTASPLWLGIIAFADLAPAVIVGPIGGAVADRRDRLRLVQVTQTLACGQAVALFGLSAWGLLDIGTLALLSLLLGTVSALNQPARLALIPSLVPPERLNSAIAINSVIFNLARFIGPAIAGAVIAAGNVEWVFALNAASFVVFLAVLARLRLTEPPPPRRERKHVVADIRDGLLYAFGERRIAVQFLLLTVIGVGARPLVELLPGLAAGVLGGGPQTLAMLTSTFGLGAIAGGLWLAGREQEKDLTRLVILASLGIAAGLLLLVATTLLWVALPAVALLGLCMVTTGAGIQTLLQLNTEPQMRGRVLSLFGVIMRGGPAMGALAMGAAGEALGLRLPLAMGAVLVAAAAVFLLAARRRGNTPA